MQQNKYDNVCIKITKTKTEESNLFTTVYEQQLEDVCKNEIIGVGTTYKEASWVLVLILFIIFISTIFYTNIKEMVKKAL